jgi:virginiamycin B lyase
VTDTDPADNNASDTDTLTPSVDLSITKTDGQTSEIPGTSISYTIVVTNNGPSTVSSLTLTDTVPAALLSPSFGAPSAGSYDPATGAWKEWQLPGNYPQPYAVFVDDKDMVWLSDFGSNALVRFDASQEKFEVYSLSSPDANVRQILGRTGEVWGAESGVDKLVVIRTNN